MGWSRARKFKGLGEEERKWEQFPEMSQVDELSVPVFQYWISTGSNSDSRSVPS